MFEEEYAGIVPLVLLLALMAFSSERRASVE